MTPRSKPRPTITLEFREVPMLPHGSKREAVFKSDGKPLYKAESLPTALSIVDSLRAIDAISFERERTIRSELQEWSEKK